MSTIVTRAGKGSPLTHNEVDANFNNLNNDKVEESTTITAGTGLSGGGDLSANRTISLANTAVTPGSYGSASAVGTFTVDAQGRLTAASNTNIAIANTAVSGLGTMSTQNANNVAITGGSVNGTTIGGSTAAAGTFTSLTNSGNLTFSGTGQRITGDMSNATQSNRLAFQTSTTNGNTSVLAIPNGTGNQAQFLAFQSSDPNNASFAQVFASAASSDVSFRSGITGTGTYLPMTFYTGGSERMRLDTSGNLGIGTGSPTTGYKLSVSAATASNSVTGAINIQSNRSYSTSNNGVIFSAIANNGTIGSHDFGALVFKEAPNSNGASAYVQMFAGGASTTQGAANKFLEGYFDGSLMNYVAAYTNATERMRIDSSGNVGIGTASPASKLDVTDTNCIVYSRGTGGYGAFYARGSGTNASYLFMGNATSGEQGRITCENGGAIAFGNTASATERMRIDSSGNVGIGQASPSYKLQVNNASASSTADAITVQNSGVSNTGHIAGIRFRYITAEPAAIRAILTNTINGAGALGFFTSSDGSGANLTERMRISAGGYVAIGRATTDTVRLFVQGSTTGSSDFALSLYNSAEAQLMYVRNDGLITTGAAASSPYNNTTGSAANMYVDSSGILYRSTSSLRYKSDVTDATHGLSDVLKLRSVTYKGKNDGDKTFGGLIAEEVHDAGLTEFVAYDNEGRPDALHYGNMVALAFKAIQELKAENDALKARIEALEAK